MYAKIKQFPLCFAYASGTPEGPSPARAKSINASTPFGEGVRRIWRLREIEYGAAARGRRPMVGAVLASCGWETHRRSQSTSASCVISRRARLRLTTSAHKTSLFSNLNERLDSKRDQDRPRAHFYGAGRATANHTTKPAIRSPDWITP